MSEGQSIDLRTQFDRYVRSEETPLAKGIDAICSLKGKEYRNSLQKRFFEFTITTPVAALTIPVSLMLGAVAKLEDGGRMFFQQDRIGKDGKVVKVTKIRSMKEGSDVAEKSVAITPTVEPEHDPRNTKLGSMIRAYEIDEFPQFLQILLGQISLIDIRSAPQYVIDLIKEKRPLTFHEWQKAYEDGRPGLLSLRSAVSNNRKDDNKRSHWDILYAKKASLGLDMFIIYRTGLRMISKIEQKLNKKEPVKYQEPEGGQDGNALVSKTNSQSG